MRPDLHSRRQWFDAYMSRVEQGAMPIPQGGRRYTCPCCGYPTLEERKRYDICPLCQWEDDGQDDADADRVPGGPNHSYSLSEARANFEKNLIMYSPDRPATSHAGNENTPTQALLKAGIVAAFNSMINETDEKVLTDLWRRVYEGERLLERELYRILGIDETDLRPEFVGYMGKIIVNPASLAHPVGFNHGILTTGGRILFLAGQTALNKEGSIVAPGDIVAQYKQVLSNLKAVVEAAGGQMTDIVKITIFVKDRDDYKARLKELGHVHKSFFGAYYPATALLEISRFYDDDAMIEIEGIAVLGLDDVAARSGAT